MIVPENILTTVVKTMQPINDKVVHFHYGNQDELNRYLDKYKGQVYPLIWMLPFKESHNVNEVTGNPTFLVAVNFKKENKSRLNNERLKWSFNEILIPVVEEFYKRLGRNNNVNYDNSDIEVMKYPNYRETKIANDPDSIHLWDALTLSLNMSFFNNCKS